MTLQLAIYETRGGRMLADWSGIAQGVELGTNTHGFADLTAYIPLPMWLAYYWFDRPGSPWVEANGDAWQAWQGRLEDVRLVAGGIQIVALGAWAAFGDVPYTAFWNDSREQLWEAGATGTADHYQFDTKDRLYIAPRKGDDFSSTVEGAIGYGRVPLGSRTQITTIGFDYELTAPVDWTASLERRDDAWVALSTEWSLVGDGSTQIGTASLPFSGADRLTFSLARTSPATYTDETGDVYLAITNVEVLASGTVVQPDDLVRDVLAAAIADNPDQLSSNESLIESPGVDVYNESYTDVKMGDLLTRLAKLGDDATPPLQWEVGVWEDGRLHFRPRGSAAQAWYIDADSLEVERSTSQVWNSIYSRYDSGESITATSTDAASVARYGLTRRQALPSRTGDSTQAERERDAALADRAQPMPRASVVIDRVLTAAGTPTPKWMVRSGDAVTIRNLPPDSGDLIDRIRTFRIAETRYHADDDTLEIVPESPLPTLDVLIAQALETP